MASKRLNLGPNPDITCGSIGGDVDVRGGDYADTLVDSDGPDHKVLQVENTLNIGTSGGDCVFRLPHQTHIRFENVGGDMNIKDVFGSIELARLGGDFASRRTCGLAIGSLGGDADMREISGDLTLSSVNGDAVIQECSGLVSVGSIGGDCIVRDVPSGFEIGKVGGDLVIRSPIRPGAHVRAHARGELGLEFPPDSSLRIILPEDSDLDLDGDLHAYNEGDKLIITVGSGEATVELSADDTISIGLDFGRSSRDFDNYMMDVSARIDTHLRGLEEHLDDLPERIRLGVERKINAAMRHVQSAEREAQRASESPQSAWGSGSSRESTGEAERMAILKMLEDGKISVEDAQKLLAALEGER